MSSPKKSGCGCFNIPISLVLVMLVGGYWGFTQLRQQRWSRSLSQSIGQQISPVLSQYIPSDWLQRLGWSPSVTGATPPPPISTTQPIAQPNLPRPNLPRSTPSAAVTATASPSPNAGTIASPKPNLPFGNPAVETTSSPSAKVSPTPNSPSTQPQPQASPKNRLGNQAIRGIYLSRYQITNNADEQTIRQRVRYYRSQGINTIIHGVWGNGCTMYKSAVLKQKVGIDSCPNQFQDQWLDWLIDEAHKNNMEVHAYFEKGIKLDENSPIFDLAVSKRWIVPGVDRTYPSIDHYVLDVELPEVAQLFRSIQVEFVKKYPTIDAVQWDDYLGYYEKLPGKVDRTARLTTFVQQMVADLKKANPNVSFDLCHHNPYWAKRYFAADWENWPIDRAFIQIYNDANFQDEMQYAERYAGVAIAETQLSRLKQLNKNPKIKGILLFPTSGKPEPAAAAFKRGL